jgi:hypothetical protein
MGLIVEGCVELVKFSHLVSSELNNESDGISDCRILLREGRKCYGGPRSITIVSVYRVPLNSTITQRRVDKNIVCRC